MLIVAYEVELFIPGVRTLKERRQVVSSIKERLKKSKNFSVVEIPESQRLDRLKLGVALVTVSEANIRDTTEEIMKMLEFYPVEVIGFRHEVFELEG